MEKFLLHSDDSCPLKNNQMRLFLPTGLSCSDSYINLCWQALLFACKISLVSAKFFQILKWLLSNGDMLHAKQNILVPYNYSYIFCFEMTGWADTGWCVGICLLWLILQKRCERRKGHWGFCCISLPGQFSMLITTLSGQWATKQRSSNVCLGYLSVAIREMLQNCRSSQPAPSCARAHAHTSSIPDIPFPPINFTSFWIIHLSSPLDARNSSCAKGILLGLGRSRVCQSPPTLWQHQAFETGSHELCHLIRVKLPHHLEPFQRLHSPMDWIWIMQHIQFLCTQQLCDISMAFVIADQKSPGLGLWHKMQVRLPKSSATLSKICHVLDISKVQESSISLKRLEKLGTERNGMD